jgi:isocitrate dehydrogenase (NAD+)
LGAGVVGGVAATHAINVGERVKVFEAVHGGPREVIGADRANPLPLLLPALDLLEACGEKAAAERIFAAIVKVLGAGVVRTRDLGGDATTTAMTRALIEAL